MDRYIQRLLEAAEKGVENAVIQTAKLLEKENKRYAPIDTGSLKDSIYTSVKKSDYMADVKAKAPYAGYVIHGTGIYNTQGVHTRSGWMYYASNPSSRYYGWHFTQGQKANDFPHRAYQKSQDEISRILQSEIHKAISNIQWR